MSINIQTKPYTNSINRLNKPKFYNMAPCLSEQKVQNNTLADMNYGSMLVKNKNVSFTGVAEAAPKIVITLSQKVNKVLQLMGKDDLLLIGKDREECMKVLKESLALFEGKISKVIRLEDPNVEGIVAFHKKGPGMQEMINLGEKDIKVEMPNEPAVFLKKGEYGPTLAGAKVTIGQETVEFAMSEEELAAIMNASNIKPVYKVGYDQYEAGIPKRENPSVAAEKTNRKIGYDQYENGQPKKEDAPSTVEKPIHKVGYDSDLYKKEDVAKTENSTAQ